MTLMRFDGGVAFIWIATGILIGDLAFLPQRHWSAAIAVLAIPGAVATGLVGLGWAAALYDAERAGRDRLSLAA